MPTVFLISSIVLGCLTTLAAHDPIPIASGGTLDYSVRGGNTRLQIKRPNQKRQELTVKRDASVARNSSPQIIRILGERPGAAILIVDKYPSIPGGLSMCQAGEEKFLRVISIATMPPKETFSIKLESCRDNIELAQPGLNWHSDTSTLHIH